MNACDAPAAVCGVSHGKGNVHNYTNYTENGYTWIYLAAAAGWQYVKGCDNVCEILSKFTYSNG